MGCMNECCRLPMLIEKIKNQYLASFESWYTLGRSFLKTPFYKLPGSTMTGGQACKQDAITILSLNLKYSGLPSYYHSIQWTE